ncbi:hypothetical protein KCU65_g36, partial [Aureobasidium melanogenum]
MVFGGMAFTPISRHSLKRFLERFARHDGLWRDQADIKLMPLAQQHDVVQILALFAVRLAWDEPCGRKMPCWRYALIHSRFEQPLASKPPQRILDVVWGEELTDACGSKSWSKILGTRKNTELEPPRKLILQKSLLCDFSSSATSQLYWYLKLLLLFTFRKHNLNTSGTQDVSGVYRHYAEWRSCNSEWVEKNKFVSGMFTVRLSRSTKEQ